MSQHDPPPPPGLPPLHDLASERATLGALLLEREAIIAVAPWLREEHFSVWKHGRIYAAALACYARREPPDLATVAAQLRAAGELEQVGGLTALGELAQEVPTALHVVYYARRVEEYGTRRALAESGGRVTAAAYDPDPDLTPDERIARAAEAVAAVAQDRTIGQGFVSAADAATEYLAACQAMEDDGDDGMLGLSTGYPDLDRVTRGLKRGELIILAGRPGDGKTSLALCIAEHIAARGMGVGMFSLEMDRELLINRLVAGQLGCDSTQVPGMVRRGDREAYGVLGALSDLPLYIDHTPALEPAAIRARAAQLAAEHPIGLWVLDYLQLARSGNPRDDEYQRVTAVSAALTAFAKETRTPVLALSQMSRDIERRSSRTPTLADLRGSGAIEQDASQVWFLYREKAEEEEEEEDGASPVTEVHVAKHRNGATGIAPLHFDRRTQRFNSLDRYRAPEGD